VRPIDPHNPWHWLAFLCEGLIFRGFTLAFLRAMVGLRPAVIIHALLFGYMHAGMHQGLSGLAARVATGLVFAAIAIWRANLSAAMVLHFFVDASFFSLG
jgi:membrane protease YdiL (CAAX protease family)